MIYYLVLTQAFLFNKLFSTTYDNWLYLIMVKLPDSKVQFLYKRIRKGS